MGVRANFSLNDVKKRLQQAKANIDNATLNVLRYLGEQCVSQARTLGSYQDQTGNLRSSVGYVIVRNGRVVETSFGSGGGAAKGEQVGRSLAGNYPTGMALIVVAGMNYAAKVESRGKDVLTSAEQYAEANLPGLLRDLSNSINRVSL